MRHKVKGFGKCCFLSMVLFLVAVNTAQAGYYQMTLTPGNVEYASFVHAGWPGGLPPATSIAGIDPYEITVGENGKAVGQRAALPVPLPGGTGAVGGGNFPTTPNPCFVLCSGGMIAEFEWIGDEAPPLVAVLHETSYAAFEGELATGIADNGLGSITQSIVEDGAVIGRFSSGKSAQIVTNPGRVFTMKASPAAYGRDFRGGREGARAEVRYSAILLPLWLSETGAHLSSNGEHYAQLGQQILWKATLQNPQLGTVSGTYGLAIDVTDRIINHEISSGYLWDGGTSTGCEERPLQPQPFNSMNYYYTASGRGKAGFQGNLKLDGTVVDIFEISSDLEILKPVSELQVTAGIPSGFSNPFYLMSGKYSGAGFPGAQIYYTCSANFSPEREELGMGRHYVFQRAQIARTRTPDIGPPIPYYVVNALDNAYPYDQQGNTNNWEFPVDNNSGMPTQRATRDTPAQLMTTQAFLNLASQPPTNFIKSFTISDQFTVIHCFIADEYEGKPTMPVPLRTFPWFWSATGYREANVPWVRGDLFTMPPEGNFDGNTNVSYSWETVGTGEHTWENLLLNGDIP